jgi:hypothetical protein
LLNDPWVLENGMGFWTLMEKRDWWWFFVFYYFKRDLSAKENLRHLFYLSVPY